MQVVVHVDGGARGNPGPAAAAAVVSAPDGRVLDMHGITGTADGDERHVVTETELHSQLFSPDEGSPWRHPLDVDYALPFARALLDTLGLRHTPWPSRPGARVELAPLSAECSATTGSTDAVF